MKKFIIIVVLGVSVLTIKAQQNISDYSEYNSQIPVLSQNHSEELNPFSLENNKGNSPYLLRSTLGISGASNSISVKNETFIVSQSVGQASVIGTYTKKDYTIRQGFQQPLNSSILIGQHSNKVLNATVYPNPFQHSVNIAINEKVSSEIYVQLFDIKGSKVYNKEYPESQLVIIPLTELDNGIYILKVTSKDKILIVNLVKH